MRQTILYILTIFVFCNARSQTVDKQNLYKLPIENRKEKKVFIEGVLGYYLITNNNRDSIHKDEHRESEIFHKQFYVYNFKTDTDKKATYDSLVKSGFNKILNIKEITNECNWHTEIIYVDSSTVYKDPYKNPIDTNKYYKAKIKLAFYYPSKKKSDQFIFTGYIQIGGHKQTLKADNTCDNKTTTGYQILYFSDCDIYKFEFPYPDLYEYWSDFYNSEMIIYF